MDLFILRGDWWGQQPYGNVTLENNVFGHSVNGSGWHYYGALLVQRQVRERPRRQQHVRERRASSTTSAPGPYSGVWANNIGGGWSCLPGVTYRNNVGQVVRRRPTRP